MDLRRLQVLEINHISKSIEIHTHVVVNTFALINYLLF